MKRFRLETALKVRERLEKLYQKALAEQVQLEQQYRDRKQLMQDALNNYNNELDEAKAQDVTINQLLMGCLLYTSPSPRDLSTSRMPSSA